MDDRVGKLGLLLGNVCDEVSTDANLEVLTDGTDLRVFAFVATVTVVVAATVIMMLMIVAIVATVAIVDVEIMIELYYFYKVLGENRSLIRDIILLLGPLEGLYLGQLR